jgi:DNA-binding CsgD family transcriptional regulator
MKLRPGMETRLEQLEGFAGLDHIALYGPRSKSSHHAAFIFYCPQGGKTRGRIFYDEEAWRILSLKVPPLRKNGGSSPDIYSLCSKWKGLLAKAIDQRSGSGEEETGDPNFIETIQSYRRQYAVRGIVLSDAISDTQKKERSYLFVMERMDQDSDSLSRAVRQLSLNRREQEIARLLVRGLGNKEIAFALGLSLNTIKGYMKLLMGRLGVRNRVGIISMLLTQDSDSLNSFYPLPQPPQMTSPPLGQT